MEELTRLLCTSCGGDLIPKGEGVLECKYCGNTYPRSQKKEIDVELVRQLNNADDLRKRHHFDDAVETYEDIIKQYPDEILAYWGAFLSEYGVEYVRNDDGQYYPICHRVSRIRATDSQYLKGLYLHCTESDRQTYHMKADQIERTRYRTYELSCSREPYDVILAHGFGSLEMMYAKKLRAALEEKGKRVFEPQPSGDPTAREAYIYSAIQSAEYMFVIAEDISTLDGATQNTWSRFVSLPGKKLQVLHEGLKESEFPYKLRRLMQTQAPVDLTAGDWLDRTLGFIAPEKEQTTAAAEAAVVNEQDNRRLEDIFRRVENLEIGTAKDVTEAFIMTLTYVTLGNTSNAETIINMQLVKFNTGEILHVAELALELLKLTRSSEAERRNCVGKIGSLANRIRTFYPKITDAERNLYTRIKRAHLLIYLAKCFGAIKDSARQGYILDLVDYSELDDFREINEFTAMLFSNDRQEDVREVLRALPRLDGDYLLPLFLKNFTLTAQKQTLLMAVADKFVCTDKVEDELNKYLATCEETGVALTVVQIMTRCNLEVSPVAMDGALSRLQSASQARILLDNIGDRSLTGVEVDKLVLVAANSDDVANEVLRHLSFRTRVGDLGAHNMRMLIDKCHLDKIKTALFEFKLDRPLAEQLLLETMRGQREDRLSVVHLLLGFVPVVDLEKYGSFLLGNDPIKESLAEAIAPKVGKFASGNRIFEQFLRGKDSEETKRNIIAIFQKQEFPFSDQVIEMYLALYPSFYDEAYKNILFPYLAEHPAEARRHFVNHYEKLVTGYEEVLPEILKYIKFMDEASVVRFVLDFHGSQTCKDALFLRMESFLEKPKKIEADVNGVTCNLLQAYILTLRAAAPGTGTVIESLKKMGLKADEKVIAWGKKYKPSEYVEVSDIKPEIRSEVRKYFK